MITLLAATRLIPREPALVEIINKRPLEQRKVAIFFLLFWKYIKHAFLYIETMSTERLAWLVYY